MRPILLGKAELLSPEAKDIEKPTVEVVNNTGLALACLWEHTPNGGVCVTLTLPPKKKGKK